MAAALSLMALGACTASGGAVATSPRAAAAPLRVAGFAFDQGAPARKAAEADCAAQGGRLSTSIYDRYEAGAWVFVEGCA